MKFKTREDWKCIKIDRYKFKGSKRRYLTRRLIQSGLVVNKVFEDKRFWYIEPDLSLLFGTITSTFEKEKLL